MMGGFEGFGGGMGFGGIGMLVFWGLVIAGVVLLARRFTAGPSSSPVPPVRGKTAAEIALSATRRARSTRKNSSRSGMTSKRARRMAVNAKRPPI